MKRKLLSIFITLFAVMMSLSIATACSTPQDPPGGNNPPPHTCTWDNGEIIQRATRLVDGKKEFTCTSCSKTKIETYELQPPTAVEAFSARQAVVQDTFSGYDFSFSLGCELDVMGISGNVDGNYSGKYRLNKTTGEEFFTRTTSGALLFDSTIYTQTLNSQKILTTMNDDGTVEKTSVLRQENEEEFFINKAVSALVDAIEASHYNNISVAQSGNYDFTSTLNFGANHPKLSKLTSLFSKFGSQVAFKAVEFTNPTAIPFSFNINEDGKLEDFSLNLSINIQIKAIDVTVSITYSQNSSSTAINIPTDSTLITNKTDITSELNKITNSFNSLKNDNAYSLDMVAKNEFDPGWNHLAMVDSYTGRLYKNTVNGNVWFNHSYEYKSHHEEDGAEKYKYTLGNINDGSIYLVNRKGNNAVSLVEDKSLDTQFTYLTSPFVFQNTDVDCIKKITTGTTTTLNIYLSNSSAKEIQNKILSIVNSNNASGVLKVDNFMNAISTIKNAVFTVTYENNKLTEIKIKTDISYNPTDGEYTDYNISLTNELNLLVNDKLDDALEYTSPKSATSTIFPPSIGLENFSFYIL